MLLQLLLPLPATTYYHLLLLQELKLRGYTLEERAGMDGANDDI